MEGCARMAHHLACFICPKLMMLVWGRLMLKIDELVVYGPPGGEFWTSSMEESFFWFYFPPHPTQAFSAQGDTQASGTRKGGVFPATVDSRVCRDSSTPNLVTPKEGGLHVRSVGTGISSYLTRIGRRIIMG